MIRKIFDSITKTSIIKKIFVLFLIIQPILDFNILYSEGVMNAFGFSPSTIIRFLMVFILLFLVIYIKKFKKQEKGLFICFVLIAVYSILHIYNAVNFDANLTGTFSFSFSSEVFYLIRMAIPIIIIYLTINVSFTKKDFKNTIVFILLFYSGIIIISNILKIGYSTYGSDRILYNIWEWVSNLSAPIAEKATKGLFISSNRLGVLLGALLPFSLYYYFKDKGCKYLILNLLVIISMIMIGTRVSSYIWIPVLVVTIILNIMFRLINKEKMNYKKLFGILLVVVIVIPIMIYSPIRNKQYGSELKSQFEQIYNNNDYSNKLEEITTSDKNNDNLTNHEFVQQNYGNFNLSDAYVIDIYNYKADPDFWISVMQKDYSERDNGRKIQLLISQRILELNNNISMDSLFGMGYSVFKSADVYIEQDFVVQYFTIGLLGILLFIGPYIFVLVRAAIFILKNIKNRFRQELVLYCMSLCIFLFSSIMCGHILDEMITYIFMAVMSGLILKEIKNIKQEENVKLEDDKISIIIPVYNTADYLRECLDSVIKQDIGLQNLEVILINDASTDDSLKICNEYVQRYKFILINNQTNKGQAISRNEAIKVATGKYIAFLDSDDILKENNISELYKIIKSKDAQIAISRLNSFNSKKEYGYYSDKYINTYWEGDIFDNKKLINCISICSRLYKKELIENIKFLDNTIHEDNSFSLLSMFNAEKMVTVPVYLYKRRIRENDKNSSIMQNLDYKTFNDLIKNYNKVLSNLSTNKSVDFLYKYMIRQLNNNIVKYVPMQKRGIAYKDIDEFINGFNVKNRNKYKRYSKVYSCIINFAIKIIRKRGIK